MLPDPVSGGDLPPEVERDETVQRERGTEKQQEDDERHGPEGPGVRLRPQRRMGHDSPYFVIDCRTLRPRRAPSFRAEAETGAGGPSQIASP